MKFYSAVLEKTLEISPPIRAHGNHFRLWIVSKITTLGQHLTQNISAKFGEILFGGSWEVEHVSANQRPWQPSWTMNPLEKYQHLVSTSQGTFLSNLVNSIQFSWEEVKMSRPIWGHDGHLGLWITFESNNTWSAPYKEDLCQVWWHSVQLFRRSSCFKAKVRGWQTDNGCCSIP